MRWYNGGRGSCADPSHLQPVANPDRFVVVPSQLGRLLVAAMNKGETRPQRFVVGFNAAVDLIVPALPFFKSAGLAPSAAASARDHDALRSRQDLAESFAHFFEHGAAAERPFLDAAAYAELVRAAYTVPGASLFTGGNAALMGLALAEAGHDVVLVSPAGPDLRKLLPKGVRTPQSTHVPKDEVHLILEYPRGAAWGKLLAPRANRYIFTQDRSNAELRPMPYLLPTVKAEKPDVVVVSGVHALDSEPHEAIDSRLEVGVGAGGRAVGGVGSGMAGGAGQSRPSWLDHGRPGLVTDKSSLQRKVAVLRVCLLSQAVATLLDDAALAVERPVHLELAR